MSIQFHNTSPGLPQDNSPIRYNSDAEFQTILTALQELYFGANPNLKKQASDCVYQFQQKSLPEFVWRIAIRLATHTPPRSPGSLAVDRTYQFVGATMLYQCAKKGLNASKGFVVEALSSVLALLDAKLGNSSGSSGGMSSGQGMSLNGQNIAPQGQVTFDRAIESKLASVCACLLVRADRGVVQSFMGSFLSRFRLHSTHVSQYIQDQSGSACNPFEVQDSGGSSGSSRFIDALQSERLGVEKLTQFAQQTVCACAQPPRGYSVTFDGIRSTRAVKNCWIKCLIILEILANLPTELDNAYPMKKSIIADTDMGKVLLSFVEEVLTCASLHLNQAGLHTTKTYAGQGYFCQTVCLELFRNWAKSPFEANVLLFEIVGESLEAALKQKVFLAPQNLLADLVNPVAQIVTQVKCPNCNYEIRPPPGCPRNSVDVLETMCSVLEKSSICMLLWKIRGKNNIAQGNYDPFANPTGIFNTKEGKLLQVLLQFLKDEMPKHTDVLLRAVKAKNLGLEQGFSENDSPAQSHSILVVCCRAINMVSQSFTQLLFVEEINSFLFPLISRMFLNFPTLAQEMSKIFQDLMEFVREEIEVDMQDYARGSTAGILPKDKLIVVLQKLTEPCLAGLFHFCRRDVVRIQGEEFVDYGISACSTTIAIAGGGGPCFGSERDENCSEHSCGQQFVVEITDRDNYRTISLIPMQKYTREILQVDSELSLLRDAAKDTIQELHELWGRCDSSGSMLRHIYSHFVTELMKVVRNHGDLFQLEVILVLVEGFLDEGVGDTGDFQDPFGLSQNDIDTGPDPELVNFLKILCGGCDCNSVPVDQLCLNPALYGNDEQLLGRLTKLLNTGMKEQCSQQFFDVLANGILVESCARAKVEEFRNPGIWGGGKSVYPPDMPGQLYLKSPFIKGNYYFLNIFREPVVLNAVMMCVQSASRLIENFAPAMPQLVCVSQNQSTGAQISWNPKLIPSVVNWLLRHFEFAPVACSQSLSVVLGWCGEFGSVMGEFGGFMELIDQGMMGILNGNSSSNGNGSLTGGGGDNSPNAINKIQVKSQRDFLAIDGNFHSAAASVSRHFGGGNDPNLVANGGSVSDPQESYKQCLKRLWASSFAILDHVLNGGQGSRNVHSPNISERSTTRVQFQNVDRKFLAFLVILRLRKTIFLQSQIEDPDTNMVNMKVSTGVFMVLEETNNLNRLLEVLTRFVSLPVRSVFTAQSGGVREGEKKLTVNLMDYYEDTELDAFLANGASLLFELLIGLVPGLLIRPIVSTNVIVVSSQGHQSAVLALTGKFLGSFRRVDHPIFLAKLLTAALKHKLIAKESGNDPQKAQHVQQFVHLFHVDLFEKINRLSPDLLREDPMLLTPILELVRLWTLGKVEVVVVPSITENNNQNCVGQNISQNISPNQVSPLGPWFDWSVENCVGFLDRAAVADSGGKIVDEDSEPGSPMRRRPNASFNLQNLNRNNQNNNNTSNSPNSETTAHTQDSTTYGTSNSSKNRHPFAFKEQYHPVFKVSLQVLNQLVAFSQTRQSGLVTESLVEKLILFCLVKYHSWPSDHCGTERMAIFTTFLEKYNTVFERCLRGYFWNWAQCAARIGGQGAGIGIQAGQNLHTQNQYGAPSFMNGNQFMSISHPHLRDRIPHEKVELIINCFLQLRGPQLNMFLSDSVKIMLDCWDDANYVMYEDFLTRKNDPVSQNQDMGGMIDLG